MDIAYTINNDGEREAALEAVQELSGAPEDSPEEQRLIGLVEAIETYDAGQGRANGE